MNLEEKFRGGRLIYPFDTVPPHTNKNSSGTPHLLINGKCIDKASAMNRLSNSRSINMQIQPNNKHITC